MMVEAVLVACVHVCIHTIGWRSIIIIEWVTFLSHCCREVMDV